jgi:hypothetical protein
MKIQELKKFYEKYEASWQEVNLFGIRNEDNPEKDLFNDQIGIATDEFIYLFQGTTDPGMWWTLNPVTYQGITGAAHIVEGIHKNIWRVGIHASGSAFAHEALIQTGNSIRFYRDTNKDGKIESTEPIQSGYVGINLHRAGFDDPANIGKYSAGCQVIRHHDEFVVFMDVVKSSSVYKSQREFARFSYLLMNKKSIG